ncbi:DivIVA domain-containing protein [Micromonospora sp. NBC_01813]|uniref:DivIVA domain-containing protein n=1 Tax=Micromonospora sp. NBC_01813 TaxID=2975988 RepID=UPI002DDB5BFC|nr:DivIVA domain-containing protein [Micromonospora sp. NBC_01813]WSA07621.1 DivIVA domain-containing protein [Micromonospora sp. NBC_01813]
MRELWRRWQVRRQRRKLATTPPADWPGGNGVHRAPSAGRNQRAGAYRPIRPWQVRSQRFRTVGRTAHGRGLDPADVAAFLDRIAHDLGIV